MLRVVIVGYGEMFTNLIAGTLDAGCEIVGVLRGDRIEYSPVELFFRDCFLPSQDYSYIKSYNLPEIKADSVNSDKFRQALIKLNPDIVLVGSWSEKVKKEIFSIPRLGFVNAHPSLLPLYRGSNPYYQVIKHNEEISGISLHLMDEGFDTGAILAQRSVEVLPDDTGASLKKRTVLVARGAVYELLNKLKEDVIIPLTQTEEHATTYTAKDMSIMLDFNKPARDVYAHIRAIHPWGRTFFAVGNEYLSPCPEKTFVLENNTSYNTPGEMIEIDPKHQAVTIVCGDGKIIRFEGIILFNKVWQTKRFLSKLGRESLFKKLIGE